MEKFKRSRGKKKDSKDSSPKRERNFEENYNSDGTPRSGRKPSNRRDSGRGSRGKRDFRGNSRSKREFEMTKVTCSSCGVECEVPFKPTSTKPVYCSDCFVKKGKDKPDKPSDRDFDIINEKLNKIMKALKIE